MSLANPVEVPLHDLQFYLADPTDTFAMLRRECPVYRDEVGECWAVFKHADIGTALRDPATFSSAEAFLRKTPNSAVMMEGMKGTLLVSDPPEHGIMRRLVSRGFTVRSVAALEEWVRDLCRQALDPIEVGTEYNFTHDIAEQLPTSVTCELLGIPREDMDRLVKFVDRTSGFDIEGDTDIFKDVLEINSYLEDFVTDRQQNPRDDLISVAAASDDDGNALEHWRVVKFAFMLLSAGTETTRAMLSRGVQAMYLYPGERKRVLENPGLLTTAVDEMVRWGSSLAYTGRIAARDTTIRGVDIKAGEQVLFYLMSANRDEEVFGDNANDFVADRNPNPHLGFGFGEHFCLGASLARLEGRVFFEELMKRFTDWELTGEPEPFRNFEMFRSFTKMPVVFTQRADGIVATS